MEEIKAELERIREAAVARLQEFHRTVTPEELRARVGDATCSVLISDGDFTICYATPPAERLFGYESQQLEGQSINVLVPERFREVHLEHLKRYAESPERRDMSERPGLLGIDSHGNEFQARIQLVPVYWHGAKYFMAEIFPVKAAAE